MAVKAEAIFSEEFGGNFGRFIGFGGEVGSHFVKAFEKETVNFLSVVKL